MDSDFTHCGTEKSTCYWFGALFGAEFFKTSEMGQDMHQS